MPSLAGRTRRARLGQPLADALRAFGRERGTTLFMTLLAGFQTVLAAWSRSSDLVIATTYAGRREASLEPLIGFFVNTVLLRADLSDRPTFAEHLDRCRETTLQAGEHQDVPYEKVTEMLRAAGGEWVSPLPQVIFTLQNTPPAELSLPGLDLAPLGADDGTTKAEIELAFHGGDEGPLVGTLTYDRDLYDASTMARLLGHLESLLEAATAAPGLAVDALPLLPAAERAQVVVEANDTAHRWSRDLSPTLHGPILEQAERAPDAVAVTDDGRALSYGALERASARVAGRLAAEGAGPETIVAVGIERSLELSIALLAVLRSGAAYLPLDASYPPERLRFMLEDSAAPALLVGEGGGLAQLASEAAPATAVLPITEALESGGSVPLKVRAEPDGLAYVIYTSGSTGRPKGAMNTHAAIVNRLEWMQDAYPIGPGDRVLQKTPVSFDVSVWELFWPHRMGATLVMAEPGGHRDPRYLVTTIAERAVTVLHFVPSMLGVFLEEAGLGELETLRRVVASGEALTGELEHRFFERTPPGVQLENLYGPTEAAIDVSFHPAEAGREKRPVPIGWPIANLRLTVLEPGGRPAPLGVAGELHLAGVGLARGYHRRARLTAERFVPDAVSGLAGERLYRSGDLVRRLPGGELEFVGRLDHQVKVRGNRVELGEVDVALEQHPEVARAVTVVRGGPLDARLASYFVAAPGSEVEPDALREHLAHLLPEAMLPSSLTRLDAIPLTPNGKIDRSSLPESDAVAGVVAAGWTPPRSGVERLLAEAWAEALGVERVGIDDNFFALGGDSILLLRARYLAERKGLVLSARELFAAPTVRELARSVAADRGPEALAEEPGAFDLVGEEDRARLPEGVEDAYPLSAMQAGMLFHAEWSEGSAAYHDVEALRVAGPLDPGCLVEALRQVVARHAALRTSLDLTTYSEPLQLVHSEVRLAFETRALGALDEAATEARLEAWMHAEGRKAIDWTRPPLLAATLFTRADGAWWVGVGFHHAILDGWSNATLLSEWLTLYRAALSGEGAELPAVPEAAQREFVALEQRSIAAGEDEAFWRRRLAEAPETRLGRWPLELGRAGLEPGVRVTPVPLEADLGERLSAVARRAGVPLRTVLLAAHLKALATASGQTEVVSGVVANGRPESEGADRAVGLFLVTLPLRFVPEAANWLELAERVFRAERADTAHGRFPLARLLGTEVATELTEVLFNFNHFHVLEGASRIEGLELQDWRSHQETNFALAVSFNQDAFAGRLTLDLHASADLHPLQVRQLAGLYRRALEAVADQPAEPPEAVQLLSPTDHHRALVEVAGTSCKVAGTSEDFHWIAEIESLGCWFVHDDGRFDADFGIKLHSKSCEVAGTSRGGVEETLPGLLDWALSAGAERVAVVAGARSFTFGALERASGRLAGRLTALGAGPEQRIGLLAAPSVELVVAILAIHRAGAAYVPLDPALPDERIALVVADAEIEILLASPAELERVPESVDHALELDGEVWDPSPGASPERGRALPESAAYVIYTSGSTGRPKGVMVTQRSLARYLSWVAAVPLAGVERLPLISPTAFDASLKQLFAPWFQGRSAWVPGVAPAEDPDVFLSELSRAAGALPVGVNAVPALWQALLERIEAGQPRPAGLHRILVGGEAVTAALVERTRLTLGDAVEVVNLYGPTELTANASWAQLEAAEPVSIGRAIGPARLLVLDPHFRPVPDGVSGELFGGGAGVARGYLGRPARTAASFVPDPFSASPGDRLYRTGDRVRRWPDGRIEFLGRLDEQIKVRGHRVEPGEVEAALAALPAVREAVVVAHALGAAGRLQLVAYCVPASDELPPTPTLRSDLAEQLAEPLIPSLFVALPSLPRLATGKLDRAALPEPVISSADAAPPATELEEELARLWAEVLRVPRVGVNESFFDLGGDSITSLQIVVRAREAGIALSPRQVFEHPTVAELARAVEEGTLVSAEQGAVSGEAPLTPIQARFFELGLTRPDHFNQSVLVAADGLAPRSLEEALTALLRHHDGLRARFPERGASRTAQLAEPGEPPALAVVELAGLAATDRPLALEAAAARVQRSLDLERGPLFAAVLVREGEGGAKLLLIAHHLVVDAVSWRLLLADLEAAHAAAEAGESIDLPAKTTSWPAWSEALGEWALTEEAASEESYWLDQVAKPDAELPADFEDGDGTVGTALTHQVTLGETETEALLAAGGSQPMEMLLAALASAASEALGSDRLRVWLEGHGREAFTESVDPSRTVGWFTTLYPLLLEPGWGASPTEMQTEVRARLAAVPRRGLGFGALRYLARRDDLVTAWPAGTASGLVFNYLGRSDAGEAVAGGTLKPLATGLGGDRAPSDCRGHRLEVLAMVAGGRLSVTWTYSPEQHLPSTVEALAESFLDALSALTDLEPDSADEDGGLADILAELNNPPEDAR